MNQFSVVIFTAAPAGLAQDAGGAYVKIDGREALLKSVELFLNRDNVKQIQVIFPPEELEEAKKKFGPHFGFSGVKVAGGGPKWIDQLASAKIDPAATHVLVHDGARPAVPYTDIEAIMEAAEKHPIAALAAPLRAGLIEVDEGGNPLAYRLPSEFMQLATPMVFSKARFEAMVESKAEPHASELTLVKGSPLNIRVGGGDLSLAKAMINLLPKPKIKAPDSPFEEAQW
jgi:2-C-methyl-D-erythritol 4-phosphate cytidylyltransferase/2-C-methyl-D-erythritol 2,4-cyclodiphosphate synthase